MLSSFRRECTCDVRQFRCSRVFVIATDIYNSGSLTCMAQTVDHSISLRGSTFRRSDEVNIVLLTSSQYVNHRRATSVYSYAKCECAASCYRCSAVCVCVLSVGHNRVSTKMDGPHRDAVWGVDSCGPGKPQWGAQTPQGKGHFWEHIPPHYKDSLQ